MYRIKCVLTFLCRVLYNDFAMKKTILRIISILLLLALIVLSNLADQTLSRLDRQQAAADGLLQEQKYGEAILAYGELLQKTSISFLGRDRGYLQPGMEGVLTCVDELLKTLEGAQYLADNRSIEGVLTLATHPDVPASFREDLKERAAQGAAMLEAEAERIRREEAEREAQRRQGLLNEGIEARAQGRLEEALELVKASGLEPELVGEIEAEIVQKRDEELAAEARSALDGLGFAEANALVEQIHDEKLKAEIEAEMDTGLVAKAREAIGTLQFAEAGALAEQVHDEALRESLTGEIEAEMDKTLAAEVRSAIDEHTFTEAAALAEQVHDEALREKLKGEIEAGIVRTRDEGLAAQVRSAIDALQFTEAAALAEQISDEAFREALKGEIEAGIVREHDKAVAAEALAALDTMELSRGLAMVEEVTDETARANLRQQISDDWAAIRAQLQEKYHNTLWAGAWYTLILGDGVHLTGDRRYEGLDAGLTGEDTVIGGVFGWMKLSDGKVELIGDTLGAEKIAAEITDAKDGAMGWNHGLILHGDGTVTNLGNWTYGRNAVAEWTRIKKVAAGGFHSLGLTRSGKVVAAGLDLDGQCQVSGWERVTAVAAGLRHSVALLRDGHVVAAGDNSFGQCDVDGWENIVEIRCGGNFTLGLTADGRLLAAGDNGCGQCDVGGWENVVAFDAGLWHTVALLQDGHVVCAGTSNHDQCALQGTMLFETDLEAASAGTFADGETEYVYTADPFNGPWLYYGGDGSVIVSFDKDTGKMKATRADLICTFGNPPVGILSNGEKPGSSIRASALARQNHAVFALTGDYFTFSYNADGLQIRRGHVFKEEKDEVGFGFFPDGTMRIIDPNKVTAQELVSQGVNDSWVFGPALIENGEALDIHKHPLSYNDVTMRSVMASVCPYHHIGAAYGSSTLAQVVEDLLNCGCTIAYNLDGGRSSMLVFMGKEVNKSMYMNDGWRGLQDMVGFLTSELVPKPR